MNNYALCAFANCTVLKTNGIPIAECGCLPVQGAQNVQPDLPNGYSNKIPFSIVTSRVILDKKLRAESTALCATSAGKCAPIIDPKTNATLDNTGSQFNVSPFCQEMESSPTTKKPTMYGGHFDIISVRRGLKFETWFSAIFSFLGMRIFGYEN